jgi:hypothetical protein
LDKKVIHQFWDTLAYIEYKLRNLVSTLVKVGSDVELNNLIFGGPQSSTLKN